MLYYRERIKKSYRHNLMTITFMEHLVYTGDFRNISSNKNTNKLQNMRYFPHCIKNLRLIDYKVCPSLYASVLGIEPRPRLKVPLFVIQ